MAEGEAIDTILQKFVLPSYLILDLRIGRSDKILKYSRDDMLNYLHVKNELLKLIYTCV